jgi:hypothetical protein
MRLASSSASVTNSIREPSLNEIVNTLTIRELIRIKREIFYKMPLITPVFVRGKKIPMETLKKISVISLVQIMDIRRGGPIEHKSTNKRTISEDKCVKRKKE